ncbi:MAG: c-type cytochrome [Rhodocyclaceae bacterium]|nr:c-type cytochrome [Rhodocyclaceae bacterium]
MLPVPAPLRRALALAFAASLAACGGSMDDDTGADATLVAQGREIFRHDTFGDESLWSDTLRMHEVIEAAVDPLTALAVGLKVDVDALPDDLRAAIASGAADLASPATTLSLIALDAVVGIRGTVEEAGGANRLARVGITCALCHSTVDDSFAPGIGHRLDGWPNRDLDPGAIIALSPALDPATRALYAGWGKGRFDPRFNVDGLDSPVLIPPAYGLDGVHSVTYTGDGDEIRYWNRYVAVVEMGGHGRFVEPRLNLDIRNGDDDLVSDKLAALEAYQLSLAAPAPAPGSFDAAAAARGAQLFAGSAGCATCHAGPLLTDANQRLHPAADSAAEPEMPSYASRSASGQYRTTPLRALWQHPPYFHDGSAATLEAVVRRYDARGALQLSDGEIADLVEYLKSL